MLHDKRGSWHWRGPPPAPCGREGGAEARARTPSQGPPAEACARQPAAQGVPKGLAGRSAGAIDVLLGGLLADPRSALDPLTRSFDFCRAFPSLARDFLWRVVQRRGLPAGLLGGLRGLYQLVTAVSSDSSRRPPFLIFAGATQGDPCS